MNADDVYVDPSALTCLFVHQERSRAMSAWRARVSGPLLVTHHGRTEIVNAICRTGFIGAMDSTAMEEALADLDEDFARGRLAQADILWRAALDRAADLSKTHTPRLGTRTLDVVHVACAVELRCRRFLTFDDRQRKLAAAAGLATVRLR